MTLIVACRPSPSTSDLPSVPQRKRRRRAPASGASDDCFACTKRNTKCDRRRPYCSQCLEVGKECSGYKTQLTWGVGVASRGKLRGLSLPVARSAPTIKSPPMTANNNRPRANSTISRHRNLDEDNAKIKLEPTTSSAPTSANPYTTYDFVNMAPHGTTPLPMPDWNMAISQEYALPDYHRDPVNRQRQAPQLQRLHTLSLGRGDGVRLSGSPVDAISAYAESDYTSPISQSFQNDEIPFLNSPVPMYNSYSSPNSTADQSPVIGHIGMIVDSRGPTSCPEQFYAQSDMSSSLSSSQPNLYDIAETRPHPRSSPGRSNHGEIFYDDETLAATSSSHDIDIYATSSHSSHFGWPVVADEDETSQAASDADLYRMNDSPSSSFAAEMTPRVSFFLDYYEKIMCPSLVLIDSPSNPYREHILSLAPSSPSLQHAICALAACNLRMKRKQSLSQDNWRQPMELEQLDRINGTSCPTISRRTSTQNMSPERQAPDSSQQEEYQHRSLAVQLLNQQLSDPSKARHDSVLATLFILCHYRMCESGIAQFRTQFAGVKKILGMRESGLETSNWGWMETLFTYFDAIAASINDRETQLRGNYLELIANPSNPNHALENLAGCDSVLFKTIAKLGRLNLLSQHRPVLEDYPTTTTNLPPHRSSPPAPRPRLAGQALVDFYNLHAHNFDGNGFASTLDDDAFPIGPTSPHHPSSPRTDELRTAFWTEWKASRLALQTWEFDPSRLVSQLPVSPSANQLRDFGYISEAFRYAALLYTERLACPNLPSSHLNFQNLVSQVLYYITSLEQSSGAEKFLLWPLFICGSECVNELQQSIVRTKCREIMGRSGYLNNLAGLEVLEKLWAQGTESGGGEDGNGSGNSGDRLPGGSGSPAFRWTRFMDGVDGEWIMF